MTPLKTLTRGALLALIGLAAACVDTGPTGLDLPADSPPLASALDLQTTEGKLALKWADALAEPITVRQVMGHYGGTLRLPDNRVSVWIPMGALVEDLEISLTARAGEDVAFDLNPHGTTFKLPVHVYVDLKQVEDGEEMIALLSSCMEPTSTSETLGIPLATASDELSGPIKKGGWGSLRMYLPSSTDTTATNSAGSAADTMLPLIGAQGKRSKKTATSSESTSTTEGTSGTSGTSTTEGTSSTESTSSSDGSSMTQFLCKYSILQTFSTVNGVYFKDKDVDLIETLQSFDLWLFLGRYLTFSTDHFSGYALAM